MSYKSMVVHLDDDRRCAARIEIAARLARDFDAHLAGLYIVSRPELPGYARTRPGAELFLEKSRELQREQVERMSACFRELTTRAGFDGAEMRAAEHDPIEAITLHGRYADLLILGQTDPDDDQAMMRSNFPELTVLSTGRPVLIVPYAGSFPRIGDRVLVAWNASREAARAVTDALPLLKRASKVIVLAVNPERSDGHGEQPGADISLFLARHGVRVEASQSHAGNIDIGPWLLSRAADLSVDLVVMGGYGHSRLRELALGGVTRTLLNNMTAPVLMSH